MESEQINQQVENQIEYYIFERATSFEGEIIVPSRKFALDTIVEIYSKMDISFASEYVKTAKEKLGQLDSFVPKLGNYCKVRYD